jgi:hypothetical protein
VLFELRDGRARDSLPVCGRARQREGQARSARQLDGIPTPPAEGGNGTGFICCLHASCAGRSQADFAAALGVELPADPVIEFPPIPQIPEIPRSLDMVETAPPTRTRKPAPMASEAFRGLRRRRLNSPRAVRRAVKRCHRRSWHFGDPRSRWRGDRAAAAGASALQALIVGATAHARKGTALAFVTDLLEGAFPAFVLGVKPSARTALSYRRRPECSTA